MSVSYNQNNADAFQNDVVAQILSKNNVRRNKHVKDIDPMTMIATMKANNNVAFFLVQAVEGGACFINPDGYKSIFVFDAINATNNPMQYLQEYGVLDMPNLVILDNKHVQDGIAARMSRREKTMRKQLSLSVMKCSGKGYRGGVKKMQAENMSNRIVRYIDKMRNPSWKVEKDLLFNSFLACIEVFVNYYETNTCETRLRLNAKTGNYESMHVGQMRQNHAKIMLEILAGFKGMWCWYEMVSVDQDSPFDLTKRYRDGLVYLEMMLEQDVADMNLVVNDKYRTHTANVDKALESGVENVILLLVEICNRMIEKKSTFSDICLSNESVELLKDLVDSMTLDELLNCGYIKASDVTEDVDADQLYDLAHANAFEDWREDVNTRYQCVEKFVEYASI